MFTEFMTPFIAVGLAELGDKTQIALVLLASKTTKRIQLLIGAFIGFLFVDGVAVALGSWISTVIPIGIVKIASAIVFIIFGVLMLRSRESKGTQKIMSQNPFVSSFLLISLTEWGDKTQIAAGLFATKYNPLMVLTGTLSALMILSMMAVLMGGYVSERIDPKKTSKIAGILFLLLGVLFLINSII